MVKSYTNKMNSLKDYLTDREKLMEKIEEKCKRCGTPYMTKGVYVCGCHPMFQKDYKWEDGYVEFSTPEDAEKAIIVAKALLTSEVERVLGEVEEKLPRERQLYGGWLNKDGYTVMITVDQMEGYNQALKDVRKALSVIKEEGK